MSDAQMNQTPVSDLAYENANLRAALRALVDYGAFSDEEYLSAALRELLANARAALEETK